jgi:hypothetical protein
MKHLDKAIFVLCCLAFFKTTPAYFSIRDARSLVMVLYAMAGTQA